MQDDTNIGGAASHFPATQFSVIAAIRHPEEEVRQRAWASLVELYWKPVYKYLRIKWKKSNEDAKDMTQAFFLRAMEKNFFDRYESQKSRFRTFLRMCVDRFASNEEKSAAAVKRGGAGFFISLDFSAADQELANLTTAEAPDQLFEQEWIRNFFTVCLEAFRCDCEAHAKNLHYRLFEKYDVDPDPDHPPSYADLAAEFSIKTSDVTNYLSFARREFRKIVLVKLRETTSDEEEFRLEARTLLGSKFE